jgi:hypothetical protein
MRTTHPAGASPDSSDSASTIAIAGELPSAGTYLTNGVFLYRVVNVAASAAGAMVALEDCFGMDVVRVPLTEVRAQRLRVVTPAA